MKRYDLHMLWDELGENEKGRYVKFKDCDEEIKKLKEALQMIVDLGFDNDGFEKPIKLKGLIAELVQIAKKALKGEQK